MRARGLPARVAQHAHIHAGAGTLNRRGTVYQADGSDEEHASVHAVALSLRVRRASLGPPGFAARRLIPRRLPQEALSKGEGWRGMMPGVRSSVRAVGVLTLKGYGAP